MEESSGQQTHPVVNVDAFIGKTVGRRRRPAPLGGNAPGCLAMERARALLGGVPIPRGVFRFHTHEEAHQWMITHLARAAAKK